MGTLLERGERGAIRISSVQAASRAISIRFGESRREHLLLHEVWLAFERLFRDLLLPRGDLSVGLAH